VSTTTERAAAATADYLDQRTSLGAAVKTFARKIFPDHWSFLLGEVAMYSFFVLVATGIYLTFFFEDSTAPTQSVLRCRAPWRYPKLQEDVSFPTPRRECPHMTRNSTIGRRMGFAVLRDIIHRDDMRFAWWPCRCAATNGLSAL